jgi:hypothetical protein
MSKVVRGVGKTVGGIVKGIGNAVSGIAKGVGKIFKSKLGKAILIGAAVYFGGAALMGGLNTIGTSTSFLSGMGSGLSSAATGISNAWGALTTGKGLTAAAGELGSGFMGTAGSAPATLATTAATPGMSMAPESIVSPTKAAITQVTGGAPMSLPVPAGAPPGGGLVQGAMRGWNSLGTTDKLLMAHMGTQLGSTALQMYGANKAADEQEQLNEQQKRDYNTNVGTRLYQPAMAYPVAPQPTVTRRY